MNLIFQYFRVEILHAVLHPVPLVVLVVTRPYGMPHQSAILLNVGVGYDLDEFRVYPFAVCTRNYPVDEILYIPALTP